MRTFQFNLIYFGCMKWAWSEAQEILLGHSPLSFQNAGETQHYGEYPFWSSHVELIGLMSHSTSGSVVMTYEMAPFGSGWLLEH